MLLELLITTLIWFFFVLDALPKSSKIGYAFRYILAGSIRLEKDGGGGQWVSPVSTQLTVLTEKHNSGKPVFSSSLLLTNTSFSVSELLCSLVHHTFCFLTPFTLHLSSENYDGWMVKFFMIIILHFTFSFSLRRSLKLSSACLLRKWAFFLTSITLKLQAQQTLLPPRERMLFPLGPLKCGWTCFCKSGCKILHAWMSSLRWFCKSGKHSYSGDCSNHTLTKCLTLAFSAFSG